MESSEGVLRVEIRLSKPKALRNYTDAEKTMLQFIELLEKCQNIFFDVLTRIIPYGDFYKKGKAVDIIQENIRDDRLRRRTLQLVALIPEKGSLYLARTAMNYRNIEKIMVTFAEINLSPVTISKRQEQRYLKNIYEYFHHKIHNWRIRKQCNIIGNFKEIEGLQCQVGRSWFY